MCPPYQLRTAGVRDAESMAALHADSWRRTYRGMMADAFLDGAALVNPADRDHRREDQQREDDEDEQGGAHFSPRRGP